MGMNGERENGEGGGKQDANVNHDDRGTQKAHTYNGVRIRGRRDRGQGTGESKKRGEEH